MKDPHQVVLQPFITERTVSLSQGDPRIHEESQITRKYTFLVDIDANKIEIKGAVEAIYNAGKKKKEELVEVTKVHTIKLHGKRRRVGRNIGHKPDRKKEIATLVKGQILEDYGV